MAYSSIVKPEDYFNTKLYDGNGTTNTAITGVGFQPDWLWVKARDMTYDHNIFDAVRGSTKRIATNLTDAESTQAEMIKSFASDGFNLGDNGGVNQNTKIYVAWNWKANGAGSANTDGSINTTATSVNTTAGFSIVSYTGTGSLATVGHGLGATPGLLIIKNRNTTNGWEVYHKSLGNTKYMQLHTNGTGGTSATRWNDTSPTNSVFTVNTEDGVNKSGNNMIAYCFAEKKGYSKFGSYRGNGSTNGTFIYTGFKPAFVITKKTSGTGDWMIRDNKRDFNGSWRDLYANNTNAETSPDSNTQSDLLSNDFKLRMTHTNHNEDGGDYIYMAFAEEPLVANVGASIPATAR